MSEDLVVQILFAASAIVAAVVAAGTKLKARLLSVATAVCLAAAAFFVEASSFLDK